MDRGLASAPQTSRRDSARRPLQVFVSVLAATTAASALAGCAVSVGTPEHRTNSYSVPGHVQSLVVTAHAGDVHVTGAASAVVSVTEHITFRGTAPTTTHRTAAGTLTLDSSCPIGETCSVGYDIRVPRATTVRVTAGVGSVRLSDLAGPVTVSTNAGTIHLASLAGPVHATSRAGQVTGQQISSGQAALRVMAGQIDVTFSAAPAAITATTDVGAVTLRVPATTPYHVTARAAVGSVHVEVPQSGTAARTITASTRTGSITIEPSP